MDFKKLSFKVKSIFNNSQFHAKLGLWKITCCISIVPMVFESIGYLIKLLMTYPIEDVYSMYEVKVCEIVEKHNVKLDEKLDRICSEFFIEEMTNILSAVEK